MITNENLKERLNAYQEVYPVPLTFIDEKIDLSEKVSKYLLSRFKRGIITLDDTTQAMLDKYLTEQGF